MGMAWHVAISRGFPRDLPMWVTKKPSDSQKEFLTTKDISASLYSHILVALHRTVL